MSHDLPQCFCGTKAIHPDDADYVFQGIPCCSRECYNGAKQTNICFDGKAPAEQLALSLT